MKVNNQLVKVLKVEECNEGCENDEPGKVISVLNGCPIIKCGENAVKILNKASWPPEETTCNECFSGCCLP